MHLFITGPIGSGKSTIINGILGKYSGPVCGFTTKKGPDTPEGSRIFMYPAAGGEGLAIAVCRSAGDFSADIPAINTFGCALLSDIPDGALVLMDELGFFESKAEEFCAAVLGMLDRNVTVIGAVKPMSTPFLDAVRNHGRVMVVPVTEMTRVYARERAEALFFYQNTEADKNAAGRS